MHGTAAKTEQQSPPWSDDELDTLARLYSQQRSNAEIAKELGRAESAVAVKATRLSFPTRSMLRRDAKSERPRYKLRHCLCCQRLFFSAHAGNRMCDPCRGTAESSDDYVIQIGGAH